jgi:hypothetical protein
MQNRPMGSGDPRSRRKVLGYFLERVRRHWAQKRDRRVASHAAVAGDKIVRRSIGAV